MDSITESASTEMKTYKEGELIKGKDFIRLESPLVLLSKKTPLLTEAQDVAGAINELFQSGTGAANGSFRAVLDNAGLLKIIVQEGEKYADYEFAYETFDFSDSITTKTTSGDTVTTTTRKFSKRIITTLTDSSGAVLLLTEYDADSGEILGYTDGSDEVVYTSEWRTEYEITETQSQGASSAAVAWCIARNMEQSESLSEQQKMYRRGVLDGDNGKGEVTEPFDTTDADVTISADGVYPAATDMFNGGWFVGYDRDGDGEVDCVVRIYWNDREVNNMPYGYDHNQLCYTVTFTDGTAPYEGTTGMWKTQYNVFAEQQLQEIVELKVSGYNVIGYHADGTFVSIAMNNVSNRNVVYQGNVTPI